MAVSIILAITITVGGLIFWSRGHRYALPLPPGPPGQLFIGNASQISITKQWISFSRWKEKYGGFIFFRIFRSPYLVINSGKVALDLLEKRSVIYSDRPVSTMAAELIGWDFTLSLMPCNELWRMHRKLLHQSLNVRDIEQHRNVQLEEVNKFLSRVIQSPDTIIEQTKRLTGSIIMRVAYGYELQDDDEYVTIVEHATEGLTETFGIGFLVDLFPILKYIPEWIPGTHFKQLAREWRISTRAVVELPWAMLKNKYTNGTAPPCYGTYLLDSNGGTRCDRETEEIIKHTCATMYAAGADSTSSLISSFILAMTLHPEILHQAQAEIDRVLEPGRLPNFDDRANLPYLECIIRELYRWNPASPLAVPHKLIQDDEYEGYTIPAGTTIIPNIWAMCHDPEMYSNPASFNPARFLDLTPSEARAIDPRNFVYGFGRRICVGQKFGDETIYLSIASILALFDIRKKIVDGKAVIPDVEYSGFVGHPKPFLCDIALRSCKENIKTL